MQMLMSVSAFVHMFDFEGHWCLDMHVVMLLSIDFRLNAIIMGLNLL